MHFLFVNIITVSAGEGYVVIVTTEYIKHWDIRGAKHSSSGLAAFDNEVFLTGHLRLNTMGKYFTEKCLGNRKEVLLFAGGQSPKQLRGRGTKPH